MAYQGKTVRRRRRTLFDDLTSRQRAFLKHLKESEEFNATEAARKAGYKNPDVQAARLMKHPTVTQEIAQWQRAREKRTNVTADRIVEELANLAFSDPTDLCDEDGQLNAKNVKALDAGTRKLLDNFKQRTRIYDKGGKSCRDIEMEISTITSGTRLKALELLMKHVGIGEEKHQHEHTHNFNWDEYYKARQNETDYVSVQLKKLEVEDLKKPEGEEPIDAEYSVEELSNGAAS